MSHDADYSFLDRPDILEVIFPIAYSPLSMLTGFFNPSLSKTATRFIDVAPGISIGCGFWSTGREFPTIFYFHGNGETAGVHEWVAPYYNQSKINLFVADYRGYDASGGKPTVTNMIQDAHPLFQGFKELLKNEGFFDRYFVMGRSLGSIPALEIAFHYQEEISGLIVESGTAHNFRILWSHLGKTERDTIENSEFINKVKIRSVYRPTLIIHGQNDSIIPVEEGKELYENSAAADKRLLIIPGADHNDVMVVQQNKYFQAIRELVTAYS